jgi:hypothetical protein
MNSRVPALAVVAVTFCAVMSPMVLMPPASASRAGRFVNLRSRVLGTLNQPPALPEGMTARTPRGAQAWRPVMPPPDEVRAAVANGGWWRCSAQRVTFDLGDELAASDDPAKLADRLLLRHSAGLNQAGLRVFTGGRSTPGSAAGGEALADQTWTDPSHELFLLVQVVVSTMSREAHVSLHLIERFEP